MEKEVTMDFNDMIIMKEKRRTARAKGKRVYDKSKLGKQKYDQRQNKKVIYNPNIDYDDYSID